MLERGRHPSTLTSVLVASLYYVPPADCCFLLTLGAAGRAEGNWHALCHQSSEERRRPRG